MDEALTDRARRLVEAADTDTVTESLLVGGDEYTGEFFLYGDAPIERFRDGEHPHAMLFNDMKGVGIGSKRDTVTPDGAARSVFVVTEERLLVLVGQQDGDWVRSVDLGDVTGSAYHTGFMKHRVVVDTADSRYHLWVDASYDERDLAATVALLDAGVEDGPGDSAGRADANAGGAGVATQQADGGATDRGGDEPGASDGAANEVGGTEAGGAEAGAAGDGASRAGAAEASEGDATTTTDGRNDGPESGGESGGDPLDTLERLKELHEQGVLTDEEFQAKKSDVLDQI